MNKREFPSDEPEAKRPALFVFPKLALSPVFPSTKPVFTTSPLSLPLPATIPSPSPIYITESSDIVPCKIYSNVVIKIRNGDSVPVIFKKLESISVLIKILELDFDTDNNSSLDYFLGSLPKFPNVHKLRITAWFNPMAFEKFPNAQIVFIHRYIPEDGDVIYPKLANLKMLVMPYYTEKLPNNWKDTRCVYAVRDMRAENIVSSITHATYTYTVSEKRQCVYADKSPHLELLIYKNKTGAAKVPVDIIGASEHLKFYHY